MFEGYLFKAHWDVQKGAFVGQPAPKNLCNGRMLVRWGDSACMECTAWLKEGV